jgi:hypothetical protein
MSRKSSTTTEGNATTGTTRALRTLLISPYAIFPAWAGGKIRIVALAREFAKLGHEVTVLTPWHPRQRARLYGDEPFRVRQVPYPFLLPLVFTDRPFPFTYLVSFHPGYSAAVGRMIEDFDVVQFEHVSFADMLPVVPRSAVVGYDAHNVEFDYVRQECRQGWVADVAGRRIHRLERILTESSDCVFPVSNVDQERMASLYGLHAAKCTPAPNGIHASRQASADDDAMVCRLPGLQRFRTRAIFSGSNVDHNRRAIAFLLERVAPAAPDVGFVIHGTAAIPFLDACSLSNVFFDEDLACTSFADYAVTGMIGLNPVETGGGTNLKLLHYLSHGLSVLSTPFGMRGYDDLAAYVRVERSDAFAAALTKGGFPRPPPPDMLMDRYSWQMIAARMMQAYSQRLT